MGLEKSIEHGKEHRKPFKGAKRFFSSCRNNGGCPHCTKNRTHKNDKRNLSAEQSMEEHEKEK